MSDEPREEPEQPNEDEAEEPNEKEPERYVPSLPPDIRRSLAQFNRDWPKLFSVLSPNWQKQFAAISQENTARIVREMQKSIVPRLDDPGFLRSLRLADDVQAQWAKSLAGSSSPLPQISEAVKAWQRNYVDNISAMVAKAIAPVDFGSGLGATLKRFAERVREWEEAQRELLALIAPRGWLLSPSLAMEAPVRMLEIAKEEGVDALEEELIRLYDADRLEEIIEGFYDRPSFEQWRPLCDEAIDAHRRGSYRLAILAWLPAIEGIIREEFGPRDVFTIVRRKKGRTVKIAIAPRWHRCGRTPRRSDQGPRRGGKRSESGFEEPGSPAARNRARPSAGHRGREGLDPVRPDARSDPPLRSARGPAARAGRVTRIGFFGIADYELNEIIDFWPSRDDAEQALADVLRDEPEWVGMVGVESVEIELSAN